MRESDRYGNDRSRFHCICIALLAQTKGSNKAQSTTSTTQSANRSTKKTPSLKLPNLEIHNLEKQIQYELQSKHQMMAVQGKGSNAFLTHA
jgi:hypothetical protein